jgi:hypothetical protein
MGWLGPSNILWLDCLGAAAAGVGVLALSNWLSRLYALPRPFVITLGVANLLYGAYSGSLAVRAQRPLALVKLLVFANAAWMVFCLVAAVRLMAQASIFGLAHLIFEGCYVGWLASVEWNLRAELSFPVQNSDTIIAVENAPPSPSARRPEA